MGATVHFHYCMGKLISWGLHDHQNKNCTFCRMSDKAAYNPCATAGKNCCKDEHKQIKTDKDQKATQSDVQILKFYPDALVIAHPSLQDFHVYSFITEHPSAHAPPPANNVPVFLLNCNFRI